MGRVLKQLLKMWKKVRTRCGQCVEMYGQGVDKVWARYGQGVDKVWARYGQGQGVDNVEIAHFLQDTHMKLLGVGSPKTCIRNSNVSPCNSQHFSFGNSYILEMPGESPVFSKNSTWTYWACPRAGLRNSHVFLGIAYALFNKSLCFQRFAWTLLILPTEIQTNSGGNALGPV